ncbi:FIST signal transduction protein [Roseateles violae]|uniref:FIST C-terminal domain-containing protein n=1 Tax=Roseateles violae TaxID=3058042 RepID=A0ABT8DR55_9BURK|nr:FIST N-terminal domain-containing protein [Pelomonas sp. PFR6]MDN3919558.1 FIST C-terminal domain-containing protein [Pelomonas sp. PFR6]
MKAFAHAHATHPDAHLALALAAVQIEAQRVDSGLQPTLGWLYFTEAYLPQAEALLAEVRQRWPGVAWLGASGVGICAGGVEYFDEPALALMLAELPREQFRLFSGARPLGGWGAELAQVHADAGTPDLQELLQELAGQTGSGYLFGGLASGRADSVHLADGIWRGGLSGAAFAGDPADWRLLSRVSQGCRALGPLRRVSACEGPLLTGLDDRPALDCLLQDLALPVGTAAAEQGLREAVPRLRRTLVGLHAEGAESAGTSARDYGEQVRVRHLIGVDPSRRGIAVAERLQPGQRLSFCERNPEAARRDLLRICTELRGEAEDAGQTIAGAIFVSCAGRGGPHFGHPSAELQWVQHGLGAVPLVGFFAGGEIAHASLHGYTGVLSVFLAATAAS